MLIFGVIAVLLQCNVSNLILNTAILISAILIQKEVVEMKKTNILGATSLIFSLKLLLPTLWVLPAVIPTLFSSMLSLAGIAIILIILTFFVFASGNFIFVWIGILIFGGLLLIYLAVQIFMGLMVNLPDILAVLFEIFANIKEISINVIVAIATFFQNASVYFLEAIIFMMPILYSCVICIFILSEMSKTRKKTSENIANWVVLIVFMLGTSVPVLDYQINLGILLGVANLMYND